MVKRISVLLCISLLAGCSVICKPSEKELLEGKVRARWDALIKRDFVTAYQYAVPSFKESTTEQAYAASFGSDTVWRGVDIYRIDCEVETCKVKLLLYYTVNPRFGVPLGGNLEDRLEESWIKKEGQWWFVPPVG